MNDNQKNLNEENQQEQNLENDHSSSSNSILPQDTQGEEDLLGPALHKAETSTEETGMDKPNDFSPVPPPLEEEEPYSVMPPPVDHTQKAEPADEPQTAVTETFEQPKSSEPQGTIVLPEETSAKPEMPVTSAAEKGMSVEHPETQERTQPQTKPTQELPRQEMPQEAPREVSQEAQQTPPEPTTEPPTEPTTEPTAEPRQPKQPPKYTAYDWTWEEQTYPRGAYPEYPEEYDEDSQPYQWDYSSYEQLHKPKKKKSRGVAAFIAMLALTLLIGVGGLFAAGYVSDRNAPIVDSSVEEEALDGEAVKPSGEGEDVALGLNVTETPDRSEADLPPAGEELTVPQVAQKVIPSVVGVMKYSEGNLYEPTGLGSGIIFSVSEAGDAFIISNAHVVEFGTNFMVRMSDGEEYDAALVGEDSRSDLAVLKIEKKELGDYTPVPAEFGTSEQTQVGETVVAIGNPVNFDLSGSVTQGIVSAINREIQTDTTKMNYIQTDAAINPGNSGGALANSYGQVIGINTMKVNAIGFEGIGFAIPISDAIPILKELVAHGSVTTRAMIGITAYSVPETVDGNNIVPAGIMVQEVSPFAKFNPEIKKYDIITHCEGERVYQSGDLHAITDQKKAGDEVELTVYRKTSTVAYETLTLTVTLISSADFGD